MRFERNEMIIIRYMSLHGKKNTQHRIIGIVKLTW